MLRDALDHYNQQKDEVNQDDTLPAAAAKLTLTKRSDKADELLNAFDVASSVESIQSSTPIPTLKSTPAAAAKLTLTKRSDKANELLNAFDVASSVGVESIQSTPIPTSKSSTQIQDHGEDHGDDHVEDQMIGLGVQSTQSSTPISTSPAREHGNDQQVDHGEDHEDDHVHDGELPKDWHYDDDFFGDAYDAYEDSETDDDDDNGGVSPETITTTEAGETTPGISEVTNLLRLFNFVQLSLIFVSGI